MGSIDKSSTGLNIIIVGAGIAGLATATALLSNGKHHQVTILENHPCLNEFGASIGISPNGARGLRSLGLESQFAKVVVKHKYFMLTDGFTDEMIGRIPQNQNNYSKTNNGDEFWNINRKDYQDVLAQAAQANGAEIIFGVDITSVDVDACTIACADGREFNADVIIGADGMKSVVRKHIPKTSHVEPMPWKNESAYRCTVPKSAMTGNPLLQDLLDFPNESGFFTPGRYVLTWPLPPNRPFDVVLSVVEQNDVPLGKWGHTVDPKDPIAQFQDFSPRIRELLSHIDRAIKWTLGELPPLETCKSDNGRVVLVGDAWHAMIPHGASGGNSAIEDAVSLAECLQWAWDRRGPDGNGLYPAIAQATGIFQSVRKPRVERMQTSAHESYTFLSASGQDKIDRDTMMVGATKFYDELLEKSEEERLAMPPAPPDPSLTFGQEPFMQWLYRYDAVADIQQHLSKL